MGARRPHLCGFFTLFSPAQGSSAKPVPFDSGPLFMIKGTMMLDNIYNQVLNYNLLCVSGDVDKGPEYKSRYSGGVYMLAGPSMLNVRPSL